MAKNFWVELKIRGKGKYIRGNAEEEFRFRMVILKKGEKHSNKYLIIHGSTDESGNLIVEIHRKGLSSKSEMPIEQHFEIKGE